VRLDELTIADAVQVANIVPRRVRGAVGEASTIEAG
jgi:hypothetical protein